MYFNGINFKDNSEYSYACAKIRALENKLLTRNDFIRMLDLDNEQILQYLIDHNYHVEGIDPSDVNFLQVFSNEWSSVVEMVTEMLDNEMINKAVLIKYDFLNLKILVKTSIQNEEERQNVDDIKLFQVTTVPGDDLKEIFFEGNFDRLPDYLKHEIKVFEQIENISPSAVDIILDKAMYSKLLDFANKSGSEFLYKYYQRLVDLKNLLNLFRLKSLNKEFKDYSMILMEGGLLDTSTLSKLYAESMDMIVNRLHYLDYYNELKAGFDYYEQTNSLSEMERLFDNWMIEFVKTGKMVLFGPEAIIGYYFAKENELKNLRIVLTGKENNLDKEMVTERLRENYV